MTNLVLRPYYFNKRFASLCCALFCLSLVTACSTSRAVVTTAPPVEEYQVPEYRIGTGDQLQINVWKNLDVSGPALVRPDGRISIALIGDVSAIGRTTTELSELVSKRLAAFIRLPQVSVEVTQPANSDYQTVVRITGAVGAPTAIPYRIGMTVMDLALAAGGLTEFSSGNKSLLYRKNSDGTTTIYGLKIADIFRQGKLTTNYELRPSDVIVVPERRF